MKQYFEYKTISSEALDFLCFDNVWYNKGTVEEYDNLLQKVRNKQLTMDLLIDVATDIYNHNDEYVMEEIDDIATKIIRSATITILKREAI